MTISPSSSRSLLRLFPHTWSKRLQRVHRPSSLAYWWIWRQCITLPLARFQHAASKSWSWTLRPMAKAEVHRHGIFVFQPGFRNAPSNTSDQPCGSCHGRTGQCGPIGSPAAKRRQRLYRRLFGERLRNHRPLRWSWRRHAPRVTNPNAFFRADFVFRVSCVSRGVLAGPYRDRARFAYAWPQRFSETFETRNADDSRLSRLTGLLARGIVVRLIWVWLWVSIPGTTRTIRGGVVGLRPRVVSNAG